ncbi:MAG: nucleotidyltransferase family protein [Anaerolineae bacterium]|nr:nucleotidyltransferase family protein [Anaerolineae bacterium]
MSGVQDHLPVNLPLQEIAAFCRRWNISQLALFGSVLRDDFGPDSDIDVLVTFAPGSARTLAAISQMQQEIEALFGRPVDLVDRQSIERSPNYLRRRAILASARTVYSAA